MSVNFRVKSYYIFDQIPTMGESQPIPVTNDNKSTALYWTRVPDSCPGFSLDIGNEVKDIRENLYLYAMQRIRVGFSFVAFKSNAVLYFFLYFALLICHFRYGVNFSSPEIDLLFSKLPSEANGFINFEELVQYSFLNYNVSSRENGPGEGQSGKLLVNSYFLFDIECFIDSQ